MVNLSVVAKDAAAVIGYGLAVLSGHKAPISGFLDLIELGYRTFLRVRHLSPADASDTGHPNQLLGLFKADAIDKVHVVNNLDAMRAMLVHVQQASPDAAHDMIVTAHGLWQDASEILARKLEDRKLVHSE